MMTNNHYVIAQSSLYELMIYNEAYNHGPMLAPFYEFHCKSLDNNPYTLYINFLIWFLTISKDTQGTSSSVLGRFASACERSNTNWTCYICYPMLSSQQLLYSLPLCKWFRPATRAAATSTAAAALATPSSLAAKGSACKQSQTWYARLKYWVQKDAKSNRFKVCAKEHDFVNVSNVHILEHVARVTCLICISQTVGSPPPPQLLTTPDSRFRRLDPKQLPNSGQHPTRFANATQSYGRNITTACQVNVYKFASHVTK